MTKHLCHLTCLFPYTASPSSKRKRFVGTFVITLRLTLMCQIGGNSRLPLGLKLVHRLFKEKFAGYDLPSWWLRLGILSLKPQWIPEERITIKSDKRGFSACLPARRHLYAYKQALHTLKLKEWFSINLTTQITGIYFFFFIIYTSNACTVHLS